MIRYHKIPGVPREACTYEQKIAYNLAWLIDIHYRENYRQLPTAAAKADARHDFIKRELEALSRNSDTKKFDIDGVFSALNAGLAKYLEPDGFFIASNYEQIGRAFPALYVD